MAGVYLYISFFPPALTVMMEVIAIDRLPTLQSVVPPMPVRCPLGACINLVVSSLGLKLQQAP